jgi:prepilin-type N-terminal cleavage/methylation domain-containing protein
MRIHELDANRKENCGSGFTLIELTIVLVIVGLVTTMALFSVDKLLPETRIAGAARDVGSGLRETRSLAWTRGQPYWFQYDLDDLAFRTISPFVEGENPLRLAEDEDDREHFPWNYLDIQDVEMEVWFTDGRKIRAGRTALIRFDPRGTFPYHYVIFTDKSSGDDMGNYKVYTLEVRGLTGEVSFYEGLPQIDVPTDADFAD